MEEKPTCHDYIEIITNRAIFYNLEDSRRGRKKREAEGPNPRVAALGGGAAALDP